MRRSPSIAKLAAKLTPRLLWGTVSCAAIAACTAGPVGPEARFVDSTKGDITAMPWPSDAYLNDGKVEVAPLPFSGGDAVLALEATLATMNGFGTTTSVFFPVDEVVTVEANAAATLVDLATQTAIAKWPLFFREKSMQLVAMAPRGTALQPGHAYAIVIASGVIAATGALHPSPAMADAIAARGRFANIASYAKLRDYLKTSKTTGVMAATAFTTHTRLDWFAEVQPGLDSTPHAAVVDKVYREADFDWLLGVEADMPNTKPGLMPGGGVRHGAMAFVILGHMTGPRFLPAPNDPAAAQLALDGTLEKTGTLNIPWLLVIPKAASYANLRVVHFQHGLGSNRSNVLAVANEHAKRGFATFGIDTIFHGDRMTNPEDNKINATRAEGQDGIADLAGEEATINLFAVNGDTGNTLVTADPRLMRDNFRQASIDVMQAVRFEQSGDWSAIRAADPTLAEFSLDGSKLVYTGESFGALMGGVALAEDPALTAAVLDVGGGGIVMDLVAYSPSFVPLFGPLASLFIDNTVNLENPDQGPPRTQLSLNMMAMAMEPADGLALSAIVDDNKHALLLEAKDDEVVPNTSSEALALAWGMKQVMVPGAIATTEAALPQAPSPLVTTPVRGLVQITGSTHTQYSLQEDSSRWLPPWPPFVKRESSLDVVHPIERVRGFALEFIDSVVAGAPKIGEPTLPLP